MATEGTHLGVDLDREPTCLGCLDVGHERGLRVVGLLDERLQTIDLAVDPADLVAERVDAALDATGFGLGPPEAVLNRAQLAA